MSLKMSAQQHRCKQRQLFTPSSTNLFVRYLPHEVDDNRLREIFSTFGRITSSMVMRDIHNGQSLGTAFVRYETHEEAQVALREANGMPLGVKTISVQWAKQQHDGTPAGEDRLKMNKLFLRNVPLDVTEEELSTMMAAYGAVERVSLHNDTAPVTDPALRRRIAFVTFAELGAAETALREVHNTCAFNGCCGIPLMGKLSEDYSHKARGTGSFTPVGECATKAPRSLVMPHPNSLEASVRPYCLQSVRPSRGSAGSCSVVSISLNSASASLAASVAERWQDADFRAVEYDGTHGSRCAYDRQPHTEGCRWAPLPTSRAEQYRHNPYELGCVAIPMR